MKKKQRLWPTIRLERLRHVPWKRGWFQSVQSIYPKTQQQSISKDLTELKLACKHKYWNGNPVPIQAVLRTRLNTSTTRSDSLAPQLQAVYLTPDFSCVDGCVGLGKKRDLEFSSVLPNSGVGRMNGGIGVL